MTPQEHIDAAELMLKDLNGYDEPFTEHQIMANALIAVGHALIALAVETGAPHPTAPAATT